MKSSFLFAAALIGLVLLPPAIAQNARTLQLGQVKIYYYTLNGTSGNGQWQGTLRGKGSNQVKITSQPYDVSANAIDLALGGKLLQPTKINAVGNVRLVSRNPATGQKVIATCDRSIYTGGTGTSDRGTIQMLGNFHAETYDKGFTGPVVIQGDSGTFQFLPNGDLAFSAESSDGSGTVTGQPIEPPAKPKGKKP